MISRHAQPPVLLFSRSFSRSFNRFRARTRRLALCLLLHAALLITLAAPPSHAAEPPENVIRIGLPLMGHSAPAPRQSSVMEILQTIFAHDNVTVQHQVMPYRRSLSALSTGRADCFLGAVQSAHLGIAPKVPIALFDLSAAHLRRGPMQWQSPASLTDKNVAHVRGFNFKSIVGIEFNPVEVDRLELALRMLRLGRVDFVLDDDQLIAEAMRTENMARDSLSVHTFQQVPVFPIFAATERGERFARIYDKGIRRVIENGEMAKILKRWGLPHDNVRELLSP